MASIFTPNIETVTVQGTKVVCRDVAANKTVVEGTDDPATIAMHKSDRKVMKAAGITN